MARFVIATDIHGTDLTGFVYEVERERADAGLLLGDYEVDLSILTETNRQIIMMAGNHEDIRLYPKMLDSIKANTKESNIRDITYENKFKCAGFTFIANPGGTYYPPQVRGFEISEVNLFNNLRQSELEKIIVMSHEPARSLGDMAYFLPTMTSIIPGFAVWMQNPELGASLRPRLMYGKHLDTLTQILERFTPIAFLSGHLHENNAFESPGKNIKTKKPVLPEEKTEHLSFTPGPYCEDPLSKFGQSIPKIKEEKWDKKIGILQIDGNKALYKIRDVLI